MSSSSLPLPLPRLSSVSIQTEDFDLSAEVAALRSGDAGVVSFFQNGASDLR